MAFSSVTGQRAGAFLAVLILFMFAGISQAQTLSGKQIAAKLPIEMDKPAPNFFDGALLGNGGMGVVVTTRPDGVVLYFGHNSVWDIRLAEAHRKEIGDFEYVFNKVKAIPGTLANLTDDPWYGEYNRMTADNYNKPYPRPFPCGSVLLGFDRRDLTLTGHKLDISTGICYVYLEKPDHTKLELRIFTDMQADNLWMQLVDKNGVPQPNVFDRIKVVPDPSTPDDIPKYEAAEDLAKGELTFRQVLPASLTQPDNQNDRAFRLTAVVNAPLHKTTRINWNGNSETMAMMEGALSTDNNFVAMISLQQGLNSAVSKTPPALAAPTAQSFTTALNNSSKVWDEYWSKSAVELSDKFLEEIWYHNVYFFNCAAKDGARCPRLFANWSYSNIGTAWHGDYHMNYNIEQPFWMTYSTNHLDKNLPYVNLVEDLMPVSRKWANEYYKLPGAYFPHSAYPVTMTMNPYPVPDWGWEVCETPWAVQGLWWHYLYSGDTAFLRNRAYGPMKAAVQFLTAYMQRPDAHGGSRWQDQDYHVFPTIPPELYGLRPGFKFNYDCAVDLTLIKFVFNAFKTAAKTLSTESDDKDLLSSIDLILAHYPAYPTAMSEKHGKVMVVVPDESPNTVYNLPNALITVFPGEDYGLHSSPDTMKLLKNTFFNQRNEGGNDLVFINLQAARIGMLNLEDFKRQIRYSLLPDGTATDMVMQVHGRYSDNTSFDWMSHMGIWFENFALPAVIDECLMQSYDGTIQLFPNWPKEKDAAFTDLRAADAFLISAEQKNGLVQNVKIISEKGNVLRIASPWGKGYVTTAAGKKRITDAVITLRTKVGEVVELSRE